MANLYNLFASPACRPRPVVRRSLLNPQEFIERVGYVCTLGAEGKVPPEECYRRIEALWRLLET